MKRIVACALPALFAIAATPASAADDAAAVCASMKKMADTINGQQSGKMIDAITRGEPAVADCDAKILAMKWAITTSVSQMKPDWQAYLKGNLEKSVCPDMNFMEAMAAGWKVAATWTPAGTVSFTTELACSDPG